LNANRFVQRSAVIVSCSLAALLVGAQTHAARPSQDARAKSKAAVPKTQEPAKQRRLPDTVEVTRDIVYAKYDTREVKLDLYRPKARPEGPMACIVVIHGGGWRSGDKQRFAPIAARLAERGYAAACIGYRLMPEVTVRECVEDCKAAVRWVRANASQYQIDPDRIGALGGSAGAHLTAMLATSSKIESLEGTGGNSGVSSRIRAGVAMATPADMTAFGRVGGQGDTAKLISPITHVDGDSAPLLLIHSKGDGTVPFEQSEKLRDKYKQAGIAVQLIEIAGNDHAFWNKPEHFDDTVNRAVQFFHENLGRAP
jgi:acetyl esterase/lipase